MKTSIFILLGALFFAGCASAPKQIYHWDASYASSVYEYLNEEGDVNEQIANLENLAQKAYQKGAKVPPGLYAHLGLLYSNLGERAKAVANFDKEIALFPESRNYMEFLKHQGAKKQTSKSLKGAKNGK
ncbi:DUF4810 domain-containing protein [Campylobacter geochelonis]|uniref:DUF4810 domain-containing protein n=1 Tax=Campylobacter geochelonis TaxID=1780362 RepID=UPI0007707AA2|nr:DUF4810 domain-containing protein [Campylobacter geochelonis]CZE47292.1 lipoprotein [Campylobacter geochelonis]